jgi:hypothetical protein
MIDLSVLHRYFIWANRMRIFFQKALVEFIRREGRVTNEEKATKFFADDPGIFMSYWYGGLYVVIEGWKKLNLHDPDIDRLLSSPNVDLLRKYRNGTFHFQQDYFDDKFFNFFKQDDSATWAAELNKRLGQYFLQEISRTLKSKKAK